jgi:hypothetical protein
MIRKGENAKMPNERRTAPRRIPAVRRAGIERRKFERRRRIVEEMYSPADANIAALITEALRKFENRHDGDRRSGIIRRVPYKRRIVRDRRRNRNRFSAAMNRP